MSGLTLRKLEEYLDSLPPRIEARINIFLKALRSALRDIYDFVKSVVVSTLRVLWEIRKIAYTILGFSIFLCLGVELGWSDDGVWVRSVGFVLILGCFVVLVRVFLELVTLGAATDSPEKLDPKAVPLRFFVFSVVLPIVLLVLPTLWGVRFWFGPLKVAQKEIDGGSVIAAKSLSFIENRGERFIREFRSSNAGDNSSDKKDPSDLRTSNAKSDTRVGKPSPAMVQPVLPTPTPPQTQGLPSPPPSDVYQGRVTCEPDRAQTKHSQSNPDAPDNRVELYVEGLDLDAEETIIHAAVPIHQDQEYALLHPASGAYLTDSSGYRYDLQNDSGTYSQNGGYVLRFKETYRFDLRFPALKHRVDYVYFSHPQFDILTLHLRWYRMKPRRPK